MAEDNQNDLSMEDILSSIKDILSNDSQEEDTQTPVLAVSAEEKETVAVADDAEEDVFDLSADMMIDDAEFANLTQEAETMTLDEGEPTVEITPEVATEPLLEEVDKLSDILDLPEMSDDAVSELISDVSDAKEVPYEEDIVETVSEVLPAPVEENFDTLPEPEIPNHEDLTAEIADEQENVVFPDVDAEPIFSAEDEGSAIETDVSEIAELMDNQAVLQKENEKTEDNQDEIQSEEIEEVLSAASELIEADATEDNSAVDASANIISNFAKMFAAKSKKQSEEKETPSPVIPLAPVSATEGLGNVSKTLEDLIKDTIRQMIGTAVMEKFAENTDISQYAREEIKAQTKVWLDKNLPAVVEAAVQKEIERVMAKVGR